MAIRDKFRRAVGSGKSLSSTSTSSSQSHNTAETSTLASTDSAPSSINTGSPVEKSRSRTFTWRSKSGEEKKKKKRSSSDPREKPFTETNLRYQEILGSFELTFGTNRTEQLWDADGEISPGTSRQTSLELRRC